MNTIVSQNRWVEDANGKSLDVKVLFVRNTISNLLSTSDFRVHSTQTHESGDVIDAYYAYQYKEKRFRFRTCVGPFIEVRVEDVRIFTRPRERAVPWSG